MWRGNNFSLVSTISNEQRSQPAELITMDAGDSDGALYRHSARPQWGAALLIRDSGDYLIFQFEDGEQRKFQRAFTHLFERVIGEDSSALRAVVRRPPPPKTPRPAPRTPVMSFDDQVRVFRSLYPAGFADPSYLSTWRGEETRVLKRHLNPVVARAQSTLGRSAISQLMGAQRYTDIHTALVELFTATSLITAPAGARTLGALAPEHHATFAGALAALLHGEGGPQIEHYLEALERLGLTVSWPMLTVPLGLVHPTEQAFVWHTVVQLQADILSPEERYSRRPDPAAYARALALARRTEEGLTAAGLTARDLLDVGVFTWETLRPRGIKTLATLNEA